MELKNKSCLVTGGGGFIGRHLVKALFQKEAHVSVLDNFSRGDEVAYRLYRRYLREGKKFHDVFLRRYSISSIWQVYSEIDVIFHLAASMGDITHNQKNHLSMMKQNLETNLATGNLVEKIAHSRIEKGLPPLRLIYSSTACIYAPDVPIPTPESAGRICDPEPTNHGYGIGKWVGEQIFSRLGEEISPGLDVRIARFFNAYGPGDYFIDKAHVVPALIRKAMEETRLDVLGSGNQRRSFVHAKDLCQGLLLLAEKEVPDFCDLDEPDWNIVNLGTLTDHSITEVAETILEITKKQIPIIYHLDEPEGYKIRLADVRRLKHLSGGWVPGDDFRDNVEEMVKDYQDRKKQGLLI